MDGSLFYGVAMSMWRLVVGLAIAIGGGIILGVFMARVEVVNQTVGSLVLLAINPVNCMGAISNFGTV